MSEQIAPEDFGADRGGVHVFENDDGIFFAYGHPEVGPLTAAIHQEAAEWGWAEAADEYTVEDVQDAAVPLWGNNVRRDPGGIWWDRCAGPEVEGAFPYTMIDPT